MRRFLHVILLIIIAIALVAATAWGALAIYYSNSPGEEFRKVPAYLFAVFGAALFAGYLSSAYRWRALLVFALAFISVLAWWSTIQPRQDLDWAPEYAKPPYAVVNGDI